MSVPGRPERLGLRRCDGAGRRSRRRPRWRSRRCAAPAAWADVTVDPDRLPRPGRPGRHGHRARRRSPTDRRAETDRAGARANVPARAPRPPVDNTYLSFTTSQGTCTRIGASGADCDFGPVPASGVGDAERDRSRRTSRSRRPSPSYRCTAPPNCDFETALGQRGLDHPGQLPDRVRGLEQDQAQGRAGDLHQQLLQGEGEGQGQEGQPHLRLPQGPEVGVRQPRIRAAGLRADREEAGLEAEGEDRGRRLRPGLLRAQDRRQAKGGKQLKRTATFQVCGSTFE